MTASGQKSSTISLSFKTRHKVLSHDQSAQSIIT